MTEQQEITAEQLADMEQKDRLQAGYCGFCEGKLGPELTDKVNARDNPEWAKYKVCEKCKYQWNGHYYR